jgi:hypothetical protein
VIADLAQSGGVGTDAALVTVGFGVQIDDGTAARLVLTGLGGLGT